MTESEESEESQDDGDVAARHNASGKRALGSKDKSLKKRARGNSLPEWPQSATEVCAGVNDTWNVFQSANRGRQVTVADYNAACLLLSLPVIATTMVNHSSVGEG